MRKAKRVLIVIAFTVSIIQLAVYVVDLLNPPSESLLEAYASRGREALSRLLVYWLIGASSLLASIWMTKLSDFLADCMAIAGVYLMLLGANGGLLSVGLVPYQIAATTVNLFVIGYLAVRVGHKSIAA